MDVRLFSLLLTFVSDLNQPKEEDEEFKKDFISGVKNVM